MALGVLEGQQKISRLEDENYQLKLKIAVLEKRGSSATSSSGLASKLAETQRALEKERAALQQLKLDVANSEAESKARRERDAVRMKSYYQRQVDEFVLQHKRQSANDAAKYADNANNTKNAESARLQIKRLTAANEQLTRDNQRLQNDLSQSTLRDELASMEARMLAAQSAQQEAESKLYAIELRLEEQRRENATLADKISFHKQQMAKLSQELSRANLKCNELQADKTRLESSAWAPPLMKVAEQEVIASEAKTRALVAETNAKKVESDLRALRVEHELLQSQLRSAQGELERKKRKGLDSEVKEHRHRLAQLERQNTGLISEHARDQLAMQALKRRNEELEKTVVRLPSDDAVALGRQLHEAQAQLQRNEQRYQRSMTEAQVTASQQHQAEVEKLQAEHNKRLTEISQRLGLNE